MLKHIVAKDELEPQLQKGAEISLTNYLSSKLYFFSPKSAMPGPKFSKPSKGSAPNLKHIVSKDEVTTPKGGRDIADKLFKFKNAVF